MSTTMRYMVYRATIAAVGVAVCMAAIATPTAAAQESGGCVAPDVRFISEPDDTGNDVWVSGDLDVLAGARHKLTIATSDDGDGRADQAQDHESVIVQLVGESGVAWQSKPTVDLADDSDVVASVEPAKVPKAIEWHRMVIMHAGDELGSFDSVRVDRVCWEPLLKVAEPDGLEPAPETTVPPTTEAPERAPELAVTGIETNVLATVCLLYTSPSPRDATLSRMPSSA